MANTTNFGWETPDDTDLVKDGALAMRTLGNAIDTSLVDLKGGTTGQVLSKNTNTDMDFTWVTPNDADAIQNTIVDAKGDLITATAADSPARLAVGTNGFILTADSAEATGLKWAAPAPAAATFVGVSLTATGAQSISNNTETALTFDSELFDTDGFHSNATNTSRITIPTGKGGKYLFTGVFYFNANATGYRYSVFKKNGTRVSGYAQVPGASASIEIALSHSVVLDLVATDYVEFFVRQNSGGALDNLSQYSYFQAIYLGA